MMWIRLCLVVASVSALPLGDERDEATVEQKFFQIRNRMALEEARGSDRLTTPREKNLLTTSKSYNKYGQEYYFRRWPNNVIPIKFDSAYSRNEIRKVRKALNELESLSCFTFPPRRHEEDYIYLERGNACNSFVGRIGGRQSLFLAETCLINELIQHEFMHAIGFNHEHQRLDRDQHIVIFWKNIRRAYYHDFDKENYQSYGRPYTPDSIMHYKNNTFGKHLSDGSISITMGTRLPCVRLGLNEMTKEDILRLRSVGKCHGADPNWPKSQEDDYGVQNRAISGVDCSDSKKACRQYAKDGYCGHKDSAAMMKKLCPNACKPECLPK